MHVVINAVLNKHNCVLSNAGLSKALTKTRICTSLKSDFYFRFHSPLHTKSTLLNFICTWDLAKIWLPWQRPLNLCNHKCLVSIGRPRKPPLISNHILVISHRNVFICIYSNFSPKIGSHGNAPLSLV